MATMFELLKIIDGMRPAILLPPKSKILRLCRLPISFGISPATNVKIICQLSFGMHSNAFYVIKNYSGRKTDAFKIEMESYVIRNCGNKSKTVEFRRIVW